jgi:hypothetical protein
MLRPLPFEGSAPRGSPRLDWALLACSQLCIWPCAPVLCACFPSALTRRREQFFSPSGWEAVCGPQAAQLGFIPCEPGAGRPNPKWKLVLCQMWANSICPTPSLHEMFSGLLGKVTLYWSIHAEARSWNFSRGPWGSRRNIKRLEILSLLPNPTPIMRPVAGMCSTHHVAHTAGIYTRVLH